MKLLYNIFFSIILLIWKCNGQCQTIENIFKELNLEYLFNVKNSCCGVPSKYIKCQLFTEKVIELNLSSLNIKSEIPEKFKNLIYLQKINIENNHFFGKLPNISTYFPNLKQIKINNNDFDFNDTTNQDIYNINQNEEGTTVCCHSCFNNSSNDVQQDEIMSERSFYAASVQNSMISEEEKENEIKKNKNALKKFSSKLFRYSNSHEISTSANNNNNNNNNNYDTQHNKHQDITSIVFSNSSNYMVDEDSSVERYRDEQNPHQNQNYYYDNDNNNNYDSNYKDKNKDISHYRISSANDGSAEEHSYGRSLKSNSRKRTHDDEETKETRKLKEQLNRIKANLNSYPYGRVICDFEPKEQDEIELHFGDVVDIGCIYENGYAWVKNLRTNEEGMIQVNLLSTDLYNMDSRINEILENLMKISKIKKQMSKPFIDYTNYYSSTTSDLDNLKEKTAEEISSIVQRETSISKKIKETMKEMDGALETEEQLIRQFDLENPTSQMIDDTSMKPHEETSEMDRTIDDKSYMMDITETEYISDVSFDISQYNINNMNIK
ncbi:hypothetical protein BCR32DRAFT_244018 [Anaeromyces robustus]|uniref:SH3 domain-containing protein n=1 Tax=Anaeromyces robustus TaxID=1754192 RepID=A0A1Y1XA19_9FUNG|nr:hypothetical protein BCR32DRAFT_244018 [Anaeromyces robustus]|eukprot:ORX82588.1 hypothetical protein BCR32DRAFT_244018 [Anaeromyces robustus]